MAFFLLCAIITPSNNSYPARSFMQPTVMPLTKEEFWKVYWFSPLQMVELRNPQKYDFQFMVELRNFVVKAGAVEKFPGTVANLYLDQMAKIQAQDDDKLNLLSDFAFRKLYYDKLIVNVESLIKEESTGPAYLKDIPEHLKVAATDETPPWQLPDAKVESSIPETNTAMTNTYDTTPPTKPGSVDATLNPKAKAETKEFELNGLTFKSVTDNEGVVTFFKNDIAISEGDYSKAASMI